MDLVSTDPTREHVAKQYLGDGVYASFDGYQMWVHTPRDMSWHSIALEPAVFRDLLTFANYATGDKAEAFGL